MGEGPDPDLCKDTCKTTDFILRTELFKMLSISVYYPKGDDFNELIMTFTRTVVRFTFLV